MARKVMRSLWDISNDVSREALSTKPVGLVDDYTYGDRADLKDRMADGVPDGPEAGLITDENHNGIPDDIENPDDSNTVIPDAGDPVAGMCGAILPEDEMVEVDIVSVTVIEDAPEDDAIHTDKNIYGYNEDKPIDEEEKEVMKEKYPVQQIVEKDEQTEEVEDLKDETDQLGVGEDTRERG